MTTLLVVMSFLEGLLILAAGRAVLHRGGAILTRNDGWLGWDKVDHGVGGAAASLPLSLLFWGAWGQWGWGLALIVLGVEVLELGRLASWVEKGRPQPRPDMTDGISYKDMAWGVAGALVGRWMLLHIGR